MSPFCIRQDYTPRLDNHPSDERGQTDACQDDVYRAARQAMDDNALMSVLDVGCGGGFKLMKYFHDVRTLGLDLEPNFSFVCEKWPNREWGVGDLSATVAGFDLLIASDIIEHLADPDELLGFIERAQPKVAVISTPNRDNLADWTWPGPPRNTCHVREWSAPEFAQYIGQRFDILEHYFPDPSRRDVSTMWTVVRCR